MQSRLDRALLGKTS